MNFWETFRAAPINLAKHWRNWGSSIQKEKSRYFFEIPPFSVSQPIWLGSSYITTEFLLVDFNTDFTLQPWHLTPPANVNFCLAVRWPAGNNSGLGVTRYKLWSNVGERLVFPNYSGQVINKNAVFEIWTTANYQVTSLDQPYRIDISALLTPNNVKLCCYEDSNQIKTFFEYCGIFAVENLDGEYDIPIMFNTCINAIQPSGETFYRIDENNNIRANESTDLRVYI